MTKINQSLLDRLGKTLGVNKARVYQLITDISAKNRVPRHLGALLLAGENGISFQKYATPQDLADLRHTPNHVPITVSERRSPPRAAPPISKACDHEIITHTDPKTREKVVKVRLKQKFPPKIRSVASSILKDLRLALDQAFCEAAVALGRKHAKGIYFPFGKDPENLKEVVKTKCVNVDQHLIDYCRAFKPYYGGDSDGVLWSMSSLAGSTHQTSVGVGFQDTASFAEAIIQATGPLQIIINKWNDLHNELEVARLPAGSELHLKDDFTLRLQVVFAGRSHALSYRPLVPSLHQLLGIVEGIVLGIEAESARILRERAS